MKVCVAATPVSMEPARIFPRHPPLLLASFAASLRAGGVSVNALDAFLEQLSVESAADRIARQAPDAVVLMPNDVARETPPGVTVALAARLKDLGIPCVLVAGVGDARFLRCLVEEGAAIDAAFLGDPEALVTALLGALEQGAGEALRRVPGAMVRGVAGVPAPARASDLDALPIAAWDLLDLSRYVVLPHRRGEPASYPILASRGCWWNRCAFCQDLACVKSSDYRVRSPESVAAEMQEAARRLGTTHFLFHDAVFPAGSEWLERFRSALARSRFAPRWFCMCRADAVSRQVLLSMKSCGATGVAYGLESGSPEILVRMNKGHDVETGRRAVALTREAGLDPAATFVFGFPGETPALARETVELACSLPLAFAQFLLVKWHQVPEAWLGDGTLVEDWDLSQFDYRGMVFVPSAYGTLGRLRFARSYAYARFYARPRYVLGMAAKVRSLHDARRYVDGARTLVSAILNR